MATDLIVDYNATVSSVAAQVDTTTQAYDGTEQVSYTMNKEFNVSKSLLTISTDNDSSTNSIIIRDSKISTASQYYAFGTTMFFKASVNDERQCGGMGFFVDGNGATGYFVSITSTSTAAAQGGNEFKFYKVKNGNKYLLDDSQSVSDAARLTGIYSGTSYKIDIFVNVGSTKTDLIAYVNGFKITASDSSKIVGSNTIAVLPKSSKIGLYANLGTAAFDYVYTMQIDSTQFNSANTYNIYKQSFSKTAIDVAYGDLFVSGTQEVDSSTSTKFVQEFGPVAREIRNIKTRYDSTPAFPKYITTGINQAVSVIGSKLSSFTADIYLLNNSGTYVPIDDGALTSFAIIGNTITTSSPLTYMDDTLDPYSPQEPVAFNSQWIQKYIDAKNLSDWIKNQWKNQQRTIELVTFANPLISVSDIITVDYPFNGLSSSNKFVVTNVTQVWKDGLETTITARSIYS